MRIVNLMSGVCLLLVLAMIPAFAQFAHTTGLPRAMAMVLIAGGIAACSLKRA